MNNGWHAFFMTTMIAIGVIVLFIEVGYLTNRAAHNYELALQDAQRVQQARMKQEQATAFACGYIYAKHANKEYGWFERECPGKRTIALESGFTEVQ